MHTQASNPRRAGFTLAESAISVVIVSVMMCAALTAVAGAARGGRIEADRQRGLFLAEQLMGELLGKAYLEPGAATSAIGPEVGEVNGNRDLFDDVDDYAGWKEPQSAGDTGLEYADGTAIPQTGGWSRDVAIVYVQPTNLNVSSVSDSGFKRITVTVGHAGREAARLTGLAAKGRQ